MKIKGLLESLLLKSTIEPCVSIYVNVDARERSISDIQTVVGSLIAMKRKNLKESKAQKNYLKSIFSSFEAVRNYFINDFDRRGAKTIALFASGGEIYEVLKLPVKLKDVLVVDKEFYVQPAAATFEILPSWILIVLNRAKCSIAKYQGGKLLSYETFKSEVPSKVKKGGWFSLEEKRMRRHIDEHVRWHIKEMFDRAKKISNGFEFDGFIIGTHHHDEEIIKEMMPQKIREKFIDFVNLEPGTKEEQVLDVLNSLFEERRKKYEREKIENLMDAVSSTQKAVLGLTPVLRAANLSAIEELVVTIDFHKPGFVCKKDGFLKASSGSCEICGEGLYEVEDIVRNLQQKVMSEGGTITTLFFTEFQNSTEPVGAFLRFNI